jgi:translocator protein
MPWIDWYNSLAKPTWTPAPGTIGMIWQMPFAINMVANLIFTPIQFGMRNLPLAAVDILVVWITILWMVVAVWRHYRWVAIAQVPYFVWVSLATVLQLSITALNWGR